jgi:hypothetical protein
MNVDPSVPRSALAWSPADSAASTTRLAAPATKARSATRCSSISVAEGVPVASSTDANLFAAGLGITFLFLGGVYSAIRERFLHGGCDEE